MNEQKDPNKVNDAQAGPSVEEQSKALAPRPAQELDPVARLGQWLAAAESGKTDSASTGAAAAFRIYAVQRLGLEPWAAMELSVIKGKLVASAKLKRALVERAGYRLARENDTDETCTAVLYRSATGEVVGSYTFTIEMAKQAGLVKPDSGYVKNPERMLWARASTRVIDDFAPGVSLGIIAEEDAAKMTGADVVESSAEEQYATADELGDLEHEGEAPTFVAPEKAKAK